MVILGWQIEVHRSVSRVFAILRWHNCETNKVTEIDIFCGPIWFLIERVNVDESAEEVAAFYTNGGR